MDYAPNEGQELLADLINSKNHYDLHVGNDIPTAAGPQKQGDDQLTLYNLPNKDGSAKSAMNKPVAGVDAEIAINPDFENAHRKSLTGLKVAPLWTVAFHELAEAFATLDQGARNENGSQDYGLAHSMAMAREDRLRWQRSFLANYNPGSGGPPGHPAEEVTIKQ